MTDHINHVVWATVAWLLYAGLIVNGAYRASGINHAAKLDISAGSRLIGLLMFASVVLLWTSQLPDFGIAFVGGMAAAAVLAALMFVLRRRIEWRETLAQIAVNERASAALALQARAPAAQRANVETPGADSQAIATSAEPSQTG